jgi:Flp pilus assembly protein TadB
MAQTRRKRQTKHRGNAAGVVESRGRTGRKPTAAEKSGKARDAAQAKEKLLDKRDRPPSWRAAFVKAMFASILMMLLVIVVLNRSNQGIGLFPVVLVAYTLISYYTDKWVYDRRQRKKLKQGGGGRPAPQ